MYIWNLIPVGAYPLVCPTAGSTFARGALPVWGACVVNLIWGFLHRCTMEPACRGASGGPERFPPTAPSHRSWWLPKFFFPLKSSQGTPVFPGHFGVLLLLQGGEQAAGSGWPRGSGCTEHVLFWNTPLPHPSLAVSYPGVFPLYSSRWSSVRCRPLLLSPSQLLSRLLEITFLFSIFGENSKDVGGFQAQPGRARGSSSSSVTLGREGNLSEPWRPRPSSGHDGTSSWVWPGALVSGPSCRPAPTPLSPGPRGQPPCTGWSRQGEHL